MRRLVLLMGLLAVNPLWAPPSQPADAPADFDTPHPFPFVEGKSSPECRHRVATLREVVADRIRMETWVRDGFPFSIYSLQYYLHVSRLTAEETALTLDMIERREVTVIFGANQEVRHLVPYREELLPFLMAVGRAKLEERVQRALVDGILPYGHLRFVCSTPASAPAEASAVPDQSAEFARNRLAWTTWLSAQMREYPDLREAFLAFKGTIP